MNRFTAETTVGDIVARVPASARVFEDHQIDFCCGGQTAVAEACAARGLDATTVLEEVELAAAAPDPSPAGWEHAPLAELMDHIVGAHHAYLRTQLPRLRAMMNKVVDKHGERHGETLRPASAILEEMTGELEAHLMKEEAILFPLIRTLEATAGAAAGPASFHCGSVRNPIRVMVMEHDSAASALAGLRRVTAGYAPPPDACNTFRALYFELSELERDLHRHIHLENHILFPRAIGMESAR